MAKYRKVDVRIWNDGKFTGMSDNGKLAFLLLLTHPHMTSLGAMRATIPGLASELNWSAEVFRSAFMESVNQRVVRHDEKSSFVWLPNFLKYNRPENPNVVKSWVASLDLLPECELKQELIDDARNYIHALGGTFIEKMPKAFERVCQRLSKGYAKGFPENGDTESDLKPVDATSSSDSTLKPFESLSKGYAKGFRKGMPNQEQEQEHLSITKSAEAEQKPQAQSEVASANANLPGIPIPPEALGTDGLPMTMLERAMRNANHPSYRNVPYRLPGKTVAEMAQSWERTVPNG